MLQLFIIGVIIMGWLLYKWWIYPSTYWKDRGFPQLDYKFPYGSNPELVDMKTYSGCAYEKIYKEMGDLKYAGIVLVRRPYLVLKDPEILRAIMVKDFIHFTDRMNVDNINEPLSHHLFNLGGDKWKALRVKLSPTFTSGKLKLMFPLFEACSKNLLDILEKEISSNPEVEVKGIMSRFTTQVVGTCAYGIDINSLGDKNNEFVKLTQNMFNSYVPFKRICILASHLIFPGAEKLIKPRFTPISWERFFTSIVQDTVGHRTKTGYSRNDFIDLLIEIRKTGEINIDSIETEGKKTVPIKDSDLVAQVFVFLAAGFETSSSVTSYCLYELAKNPDIQEKLRKEVHAGLPLSYQSLLDSHYLDMVVNETMRKYPTLPLLSRKCTKPYKMPNGAVLEKDIRVMIPVYALHHDPQHFPEPDKFDPERFNQENKNSRHPFSYLPFGEGPRICIGIRFGLLQAKMGIAAILSKYRVETTANTVSPMKFVATPIVSGVGHPITLAFKPL